MTRHHDRGSFTAELAAGLPALLLLFYAGLTAVVAVMDQARCLDAAREAAVAAARGEVWSSSSSSASARAERLAPPGAKIRVSSDAETVTVVVTSRVRTPGGHLPGLTVQAKSHAAREPAQVQW
ncbi:Flp pilus assembly protein TadG [Actinoplanes lutulentus]|uniref:TadE family type IV pilus minor pilin n=1 Tax=Actinoplanes lutulentus TaxID=1287878 RepID=UPI000DBA8EA1|nr:TadE family type IV pilus minor pilin [Actinoplanes lutulentus]MBB2945079.1 Flp pilus assembly protein TadG [Actinoplanes lutulentus]